MRKKILGWGLLAAFVLTAGAGLVLRQQFYGNAVVTERDLYVSARAEYGQVADSLLRIENVRMSIVVFQLAEDTVGISARSTGELNVQVIMEAFGGGGHQNVAGAQIKGGNVEDIKQKAIEIAKKYIEEFDQDESNLTAGR